LDGGNTSIPIILKNAIQYSVLPVFGTGMVGPDHHSAKKATTRPKKVLILTMK
jgi:hypothetical protein